MRLILAATAAVVLLAGLVLQLLDRTVAIDLAGSALYACLVGLVIAIAWPRLPSWAIALAGFGVSAAVELLQLSGIPSRLVEALPPLRLVFGSSFDPLDLVGYAIGAVLLLGLHAGARRVVARRVAARRSASNGGEVAGVAARRSASNGGEVAAPRAPAAPPSPAAPPAD
ncbi:DUF2809 domain-containing protein [Agromyces aureus]|uniref:DUF2809 domain-containing protein n=2 Tax=Agromyces aureus TaxID=453304 RepID=A0A191WBY7_9MICO|nr:DUF2809 domain-containing protein [Agromyces aureus]ANJ25771.1 hypothetical protein ATC03_02340 [Agromyces aureus]